MNRRPIVCVESPYKPTPDCFNCNVERDQHPILCNSCKNHNLNKNKQYLREAFADCVDNGETPIASHKLYTDILDDSSDAERELGIEMGYDLMELTSYVVFYTDLGMSQGMIDAKKEAENIGLDIKYRSLENWR